MPKRSKGYIQTFEMAISRAVIGLCPATAIKRMNAILSELKHNPGACRDHLTTRMHDISEICLKRHVCPECNKKLREIRDPSKDESCYFQGQRELTKIGYKYKCTQCGRLYDID